MVRSVPRSCCSLSWFCSMLSRISSSDIFSARPRRHRRLVLGVGGRGLLLAEAVQVLRLGGVMAVAVDDHGNPPVLRVALAGKLRRAAALSNPPRRRIRRPTRPGRVRMADLPRLNGIIRALGAGPACADLLCASRHRFGHRHEHFEIRRLRVRDGAPALGQQGAAGQPAIHAQPRPDRQSRLGRAGGDADGADPGQRDRDGAMAGQAGARHGLLRHRLPAHLDGRGSRTTRSPPAAIRG